MCVPKSIEQLVERLRMEPTKAKVSLPAFTPSFPTRSGHWSGEADYMDGPAWGKLVHSGLACEDTEHRIFCNRKSGNFHQFKFCSEVVGLVFSFFQKKKKRKSQSKVCLGQTWPF